MLSAVSLSANERGDLRALLSFLTVNLLAIKKYPAPLPDDAECASNQGAGHRQLS
jgi:hypothetical protein